MNETAINESGAEIPEKTMVVLPEYGKSKERISKLLEPLAGQRRRDWFNSHFYYCLPLAIGNQYGFVVRAETDLTVRWNGGDANTDVTVDWHKVENPIQNYEGHFGSGIFTVQNNWHIRTPIGVNIMTINPPNFFKRGITHMTGVVETDNLRRDFTFNLKITEPNLDIHFRKGEPIGAFVMVPRHFADEFSMVYADEMFSEEQITAEAATVREFSRLRGNEDKTKPHEAGRLYFRGLDAWGNPFPEHQIAVGRNKPEDVEA